jgi:hypothetical protein
MVWCTGIVVSSGIPGVLKDKQFSTSKPGTNPFTGSINKMSMDQEAGLLFAVALSLGC